MQQIQVKTPQNVIINLVAAGAGRRILAFFIDLFLILLYFYLLHKVFDVLFGTYDFFSLYDDSLGFIDALFTLFLLPAQLYSLLTEFLFSGQSFGKMALQIRVVKLQGYKAGFYEYFARWLFRMVDIWVFMFVIIFMIPFYENHTFYAVVMGLSFWATGSVALISIIRTKKSQRIGDIIAGTTVVKNKQKESINITILKNLKEDYKPKFAQVIKLSDNDARIIKDTFESARNSNDYKTIHKLRIKLEEVMNVKSDLKDVEFVDTVMKDFNYYTQKL